MTAALAERLRAGVQALGLVLDDAQITRLLDFQNLLQKWNKVYNLTAVRNPEEMLTHHLLDSLAAVAPLQRHLAQRGGARLLDVGSGGGLPGVVFAICCPE
ncbi:MAG: class I SAM-dependent methyltransferase, partial [Proteobacteria bacterium]|nr:class I SAM-dependent methyltransferase [Pseudomonadota bacterium]